MTAPRTAREIMADLAAAGLSPEQMALVLELTAALGGPPSSRQARNRRYYDANKDALKAKRDQRKASENVLNVLNKTPDQGNDPRTTLFARGLSALVRITGKTPDSARSLIGKWLKVVNDEAIHVLAAIEDAERNRIADPVAWITRTLKPHGDNGHGRRTVHDAAHDLVERLHTLDQPVPGDLRGGTGGDPVRMLSKGRGE